MTTPTDPLAPTVAKPLSLAELQARSLGSGTLTSEGQRMVRTEVGGWTLAASGAVVAGLGAYLNHLHAVLAGASFLLSGVGLVGYTAAQYAHARSAVKASAVTPPAKPHPPAI